MLGVEHSTAVVPSESRDGLRVVFHRSDRRSLALSGTPGRDAFRSPCRRICMRWSRRARVAPERNAGGSRMRAGTVVQPRRRRRFVVLVPMLAVVLTASAAVALTRLVPGPQPDGTSVTPEGWRVTPAGHQTRVGPGPMAVAASPGGNPLLVADGGYSDHALLAIDPATGSIIQKIKAPGGKST